MTATNSQLDSIKVLRRVLKKRFPPFTNRRNPQGFSLRALDGDVTKRFFDLVQFPPHGLLNELRYLVVLQLYDNFRAF